MYKSFAIILVLKDILSFIAKPFNKAYPNLNLHVKTFKGSETALALGDVIVDLHTRDVPSAKLLS